MKKSRAVRLVLLGGASMALAGCDRAPPPDAKFFADVDDCTAVKDRATCEQALAESRATFAAEAPRFARQEDCEVAFGNDNCEQPQAGASQTSGGYFMPIMMGYMLGSAFRQPVYRGPGNSAVVQSGGSAYAVGRFAGAGRATAFQPTTVSRIQRGGFGATASSLRGSAGG